MGGGERERERGLGQVLWMLHNSKYCTGRFTPHRPGPLALPVPLLNTSAPDSPWHHPQLVNLISNRCSDHARMPGKPWTVADLPSSG